MTWILETEVCGGTYWIQKGDSLNGLINNAKQFPNRVIAQKALRKIERKFPKHKFMVTRPNIKEVLPDTKQD